VPSSWDGHCYYPKPDIGFQLESYLGKWYQVAGTVAPFTAGCKCIQAQYELNVRKENPPSPSDIDQQTDISHNRTTAPSPSTTPARRKARRSTFWEPPLRRTRLMAPRVFSRLGFRDRRGLRVRGRIILFRVSSSDECCVLAV
jgi:hypothetical protein